MNWIEKETLLYIHYEQINQHGGEFGLRDIGLLESALTRPQNLYYYENCTDVLKLTASLSFSLCQNHPFLDGNKRVAFVALVLFLKLNGYDLQSSPLENFTMMITLSQGELTEQTLFDWISTHSVKI